ncbi:MAG TPA: hypothetical protein DIC52_07175 [Candidatus Latescibacteria bacterium]|jgi:hypothetical protein|nr:hypothetical protein [Candidatus Latescibacterota bacterium]
MSGNQEGKSDGPQGTTVDPRPADEPRSHGIVWIVYVLLYLVAIPWYWPAGYRGPLVLGLPLWVAVSLAATLTLALWTAYVIFRYWDEGEA